MPSHTKPLVTHRADNESASRYRCCRTRDQKAAVPTDALSTIINDLNAVLSIHNLPVLSKQKQEAAKGISHRRTPYKPISHQRHTIVATCLVQLLEIPASLVICSPPLTGRLPGWMLPVLSASPLLTLSDVLHPISLAQI
mmetsp:Transcript_16331/g.39179  ORF Transcript_16331/g.39179 Transcript_16331/m.39179 type:complete len:140 (+) Transcript_16331:779-1198(+)